MRKSDILTTRVIASNLLQQKGAGNMLINLEEKLVEGCEKWLYQYKLNSVKKGTFERLRTSLVMMKRYPIAAVPIKDLTAAVIQRYLNQLVQDGYALTTIKKQYNLITSYVRYLMGEGAPIPPVYLNVKLPSEDTVQKHKKDVVAYSKPEQKRLLAACEEDTLAGRVVILLIETGMRIGELLALKWEDIIWERRAVFIHRTLVNHASRKLASLQDSAKSRSSNRKIPLSAKAMGLLEQMYDETANPDGLLFPSSTTDPSCVESIGYNTCRNAVLELCEKAKVKYSGFHIFRHTFATNCYYKGCDVKKLSKLMGHSEVSITYNTYIHLFGDNIDDLRDVVN